MVGRYEKRHMMKSVVDVLVEVQCDRASVSDLRGFYPVAFESLQCMVLVVLIWDTVLKGG